MKNYNPKLELMIVGKVLSDGNEFPKAKALLSQKIFSASPTAKMLWGVFSYLDNEEISITKETVINYLSQRDMLNNVHAFGVDGLDGITSSSNGSELIVQLEKLSRKDDSDIESLAKQLVKINMDVRLGELENLIVTERKRGTDPEEILAKIEEESSKIFGLSPRSVGRLRDGKTSMKNFLDKFKKIVSGDDTLYIETGLKAIDFVLGGIGIGDLVIIAGTPGDGKSTLAHNILRNVSIHGDVVAGILSGEMDEFQINARFVQMETGIQAKDIKRGKIEGRLAEFNTAVEEIHKKTKIIYHEFSQMSMAEVRLSMMKMSELGCKLLIIDQANNLTIKRDSGSDYQDTEVKGYMIKSWAAQFGMGVILLHQMNTGANSVMRKSPFDVSLADLSKSGEAPANAVMFIRHDHEKTLIIHKKVRDGDLSKGEKLLVAFDPLTMVYSNHDVGLEYIPVEWQSEE